MGQPAQTTSMSYRTAAGDVRCPLLRGGRAKTLGCACWIAPPGRA